MTAFSSFNLLDDLDFSSHNFRATSYFGCTFIPTYPQVCVHCNGSLGSAINGLPLPEHQSLRGEFLEDGGQAAGIGEA